MAERIVPFYNFRDGINAVPGFTDGRIRDIENLDIDDTGFLAPRKGSRILEDRLTGTYPRAVTRTFRNTAADAVRDTDIFFNGSELKLGLSGMPSLIAGLDDNAELRVIRGSDSIRVNLGGSTLSVIQPTTQIAVFPAGLPGGGVGTFEDGDEVSVVIFLDSEERDTYTDNGNRLKFSEGNQLVVAHYLGDETNEPLTRYYRFSENTHHVSVRRGQILMLADGETQQFIDILNNRVYNWTLNAPKIEAFELPAPETSAEQIIRLKIITAFQNSGGGNQWLWDNFPYAAQRDASEAVVRISKVVYANPSLNLISKNTVPYIDLDSPQDTFVSWLKEGPVTDPQDTTFNTRLGALLDEQIITGAEYDTLNMLMDTEPCLVLRDLDNRPDWATHLQIYLTHQNISTVSTSADLDETSPLTSGQVFTALTSGLIGLISVITEDVDALIEWTISPELVNNLPDENYILWDEFVITSITDNTICIAGDSAEAIVPRYLDAFYNESPPEQLDAITLHAGRIYGVDRATEEVVFSHINGNGESNYWAFPPINALETTASGVSPIQTIEKMPDNSGLYVFKRDSIHYIEGQNIFSGLYDISVSAQTDINAADYKENIGCISPRSVKNDGSIVLFLGSDDQIYQLSGKRAVPIGLSVKPFIEDLTIDELTNVVTEWHNQRFYLTLPESVLLLNVERKYWTRFDWELKDIVWSRGGKDAESILYGIDADDNIVELQVDMPDEVYPILWETNVEVLPTGSFMTGVYVYTDSGEEVTVTVSGNEPTREITRTFIPREGNKYRAGCHIKGRNIEVKVESEAPVMIDRIMLEENV